MKRPHIAAPLLRLCVVFLFVAAACAAQTGDPDLVTPQTPSSPIATQNEAVPYDPITGLERLQWFFQKSFGPKHMASGLFIAAFETARDNPREYRATWAGFGERFASWEAAITIRNAMEAGIGEFSGEDPRYFRNAELPFRRRIGNVVKQTFLARRRDGSYDLAYARYTAFTATNFISNAWRPDSESDTQHSLSRIGWAFLGRMAANASHEFWPDAKQHIFHRGN